VSGSAVPKSTTLDTLTRLPRSARAYGSELRRRPAHADSAAGRLVAASPSFVHSGRGARKPKFTLCREHPRDIAPENRCSSSPLTRGRIVRAVPCPSAEGAATDNGGDCAARIGDVDRRASCAVP
jgi:hypothetical protein